MQIYKNLKNNKKILLIFGGFASHFTHFLPFLFSECGVIILYNYSHLDFRELNILLESLQDSTIKLISFSMGVFVASEFLRQNSLKCEKIAINGTEAGIHSEFGIPLKLFRLTHKNFCLESFKQNLFGKFLAKTQDFIFLDYSVLKKELEFFMQTCKEYERSPILWDLAVISKQDLIFSSSNQIVFWKQASVKKILEIDAPHFAFFTWKF